MSMLSTAALLRWMKNGVAVVQEGRVGDPQGLGDGGVALVAGAADGVEALLLGVQAPRVQVELPRQDLGFEQLDELGGGQAGIGQAPGVPRAGQAALAHAAIEPLLERVSRGGLWHPERMPVFSYRERCSSQSAGRPWRRSTSLKVRAQAEQ